MCVHITYVSKTDQVMCVYACMRVSMQEEMNVRVWMCMCVNVRGVYVRVSERE